MKYASCRWECLCGESQDLGEAGIQRYALSVSNLDSYSRLLTDYTVKNSKSHTESMAEKVQARSAAPFAVKVAGKVAGTLRRAVRN